MPLLRMVKITKRFPGVVALDEVSLELHAGEVLCLVGENGAGKSTLMRILAGAHGSDSGEILIDGNVVTLDSPARARSLGIGMIHQDLRLVSELSVAENIMLGVEPTGASGILVDSRAMHRSAAVALHQLGEAIDTHIPAGSLSVAMQQLVAIAQAISRSVRILVLDEPTAPLTQHEIRGLFTVIRKLRDDGVGIVYISHRLEEVFEIADRIAVLRDGRLVRTTSAGELDRRSLISLMVGRDLEHEFPDFDRVPDGEVLRVAHLSSTAVHDISLTLRRGEVLGLAGLVGAGRTEFARLLFGADRNTGGEMMLEGVKFDPRSPRDAIDTGIGFLTEDRNKLGLIAEMSVKENISLPSLGTLCWGPFVDAAKERQAAEGQAGRLQIKTPSLERKVNVLSGGNRQKVVLARWLLAKAKVLIFDEPTHGIDVGVRFDIYRIIGQLAQEGLGIIVISSDMQELLGICDRIAVMCEGRITGELRRDEATQERIMELAMPRN